MHMRVFMKVNGDYVVEEAVLAKYSTFEGALFVTTNTGIYEIPVSAATATSTLKGLTTSGHCDLSAYPAKRIHNRRGNV